MPKLVNIQTGEILLIDKKAARLGRMRRRIWAWSQALSACPEFGETGENLKMVTLTYANRKEWQKNHIREFMLKLRKHQADNLVGYSWVAELQKRGAIHYHVLIATRKKAHIPYPDKSGWWVHGATNVVRAERPYYIMKYVQKGNDDANTYPSGARIFAVWISSEVQIPKQEYRTWLHSPFPRWVVDGLDNTSDFIRPRRATGGGWIINGKVVQSPYKFLGL